MKPPHVHTHTHTHKAILLSSAAPSYGLLLGVRHALRVKERRRGRQAVVSMGDADGIPGHKENESI